MAAVDSPSLRLKADIAGYLNGTPAAADSTLWQASANAPLVFLINGDKDLFVRVAQSVMMAVRLPDANVKQLPKVVSGVGHEVLLPNTSLAEILQDMTRFSTAIDGG